MLRRPLDGLGLTAAGLVLVAAYAATLSWAMNTQTYSVWGGLIATPVVVAINAVLIWAAAHREGSWLVRLMAWGYLAKLAGAALRYVTAYVVYDGAADAERYNLYAATHYKLWRQGAFVWEVGGKQGTNALEVITTAVYTMTGPTPFAGFVVFGSLAYWGIYCLYRAAVTAVPRLDRRRYALLLFFLPSILYWPSSIGKESWLMLFVGVTALGAARLFSGGLSWLPVLLLGGAGTALVRPHIAVLLFTGLLVAQLFRPVGRQSLGVLSKGAGILVMGAAALILTQQSAAFLGIDDLSVQTISEEMGWASGQTLQGGSVFTPVPLSDPLGFPSAIVTLLFRPFPWEGHNVQMVAQSLEGLFLIVLTIASFPRWRVLWRQLFRKPYLTFALTYVIAFILAFSQFGNFGILARQRVLMLPLFLLFLALPKPSAAAASDEWSASEPKGEVTRDVVLRR